MIGPQIEEDKNPHMSHDLGSSSTYTIQARDWLIITMKDNRTIEIVFLKNESQTMITFVSESQSQNMIVLGRSLPMI